MPHQSQPDAELPMHPFVLGPSIDNNAVLCKLAHRIAADAVIADIQTEGYPVHLDGRDWFDVRAMQDLDHRSVQEVDMNTKAIQYAVGAGLVGLHPQRPYLLHIVPKVAA
jgi:hypothetical protein